MNVNSNFTLNYNATVGAISKLVKQYFESGEIKSRFDVFDKDAVPYGKGFEIDVFLAANRSPNKQAEHGQYNPAVITLTFNEVTGGQYAATLSTEKVMECVGNPEKQSEYAAEIVETLYQGWIVDKNDAVGSEFSQILTVASKSQVSVELGADVDKYAQDVITQIKAAVENMREGVTGTSYGNTVLGTKKIAARDVVIVMSNDLAALLDVHGYAKAFNDTYLEATGTRRITTQEISDNTVLVMDARNIQIRRKFESFEEFRNSDGSVNFFYNKYEYIEAAMAGGSGTGYMAFPFKVINTTEV